jgi:hypothetical protein
MSQSEQGSEILLGSHMCSGAKSVSSVSRALTLIPRRNATARIGTDFRTGLINSIRMACAQGQILLHTINVTRLLRVSLSLFTFRIIHTEVRRIAVICSHISLLLLITISVGQTCPPIKARQGLVPCRNILPYIKAMTLGQDAAAKKLLASDSQK